MEETVPRNYLAHIVHLPCVNWDYYLGINPDGPLGNPFTGGIVHTDFLRKFFIRSDKVKIFNNCSIDVGQLRYPNHINSVFFLGATVYYYTNLHKQ